MTGIINSAKGAISGVAHKVGSLLDAPSELLRAGAGRAWNALPLTNSNFVQNLVDAPSFTTRTLAKAGTALAGAAALSAATGLSLLSLPALAVAAPILRATRITQVTGQGLPADPKAPLLDTAQKISLFNERLGRPARLAPAAERAVPVVAAPTPLPPPAQTPAQITDEKMGLLVQNASISATLVFIHSSRLGLEIDQPTMIKIIQEATKPGGNLWTSYMNHLGKDLTPLQWLRACIWYFLSYTLGIVPNSIQMVATNVLREFRSKLDDSNRIHHLESGINRLLHQVNIFLEAYNQAAKDYAEAENPKGDIHFYRNEAIQRLGGASLEQLCADFSTTLVDEFFPRIPFFETLKQNRLFGWFFEVLDFVLGSIINWVGRRIVKWNLPSAIQALVKTGVDATSPTNMPFTIAITEAITELLQDLHDSPPSGGAFLPPFQPAELTQVVDKLLKTLDLTEEEGNLLDTQKKVRNRLKKYENGSLCYLGADKLWNQTVSAKFREAMVDGGHAFIGYVSENTEQILGKVLTLSNKPFETGAVVTKKDYDRAYKKLEKTADKTLRKVFNTALKGIPHGQQKASFQQMYSEQREVVNISAQEFSTCANSIWENRENNEALFPHLDQYAQALKSFVDSSPAVQADTSIPGVKDAFYESFYPLYREIPKLADKILEVQAIQTQVARPAQIERQLGEIVAVLTQLEGEIAHPANWPHYLATIEANIPAGESFKWGARIRGLRASLDAHRRSDGNGTTQGNLLAVIGNYRRQAQEESRPYGDEKARHQELLVLKITELRTQTENVSTIARNIRRSRVESEFFLNSIGKSAAAHIATPIVMRVLRKAHQFAIQQDIYDASSRIVMRSVVDAYKRP